MMPAIKSAVKCWYCKCPIDFDPNAKMAEAGLTLEYIEAKGLHPICNLCADMGELETPKEIMDQWQLKEYLDNGRHS